MVLVFVGVGTGNGTGAITGAVDGIFACGVVVAAPVAVVVAAPVAVIGCSAGGADVDVPEVSPCV